MFDFDLFTFYIPLVHLVNLVLQLRLFLQENLLVQHHLLFLVFQAILEYPSHPHLLLHQVSRLNLVDLFFPGGLVDLVGLVHFAFL